MVRKFTAAILVTIMFGFTLWTPTLEAAGNDSGVSGQCSICNTEWTLDTIAGKLVVSGKGDMCSKCYRQWETYRSAIKTVEIRPGITSIGNTAFYNCSSLTDVIIPEGVVHIGNYAFEECSSLTSITIPKGVTEIREGAFEGCSALTSIAISESVAEIGIYAFACCSALTSITIPESVTEIGGGVFYGCSALVSIEIPESVTEIGCYAFENTGYFNTDSNWEDGVLYIGNWLFQARRSITGNYRVKNGTKGIVDLAFYGCSTLESITIPEGVTKIGADVFSGCSSLVSIEMPEGITKIGNNAFYGCSALASITIPKGVTEIGWSTFADCSVLESITIPEGVTKIEGYAFADCSALESITIPESVTEIGWYAFENTGYSKTDSNWEDGVLYVGKWLIQAKKSIAGSYRVKNRTKGVASLAFYGCSFLASIMIPEGATEIGKYAFSDCSGLTCVTIPKSVITIGEGAFSNCNGLTAVCYTGNKTEWDAMRIDEYNTSLKNATIYYDSEKCAHKSTSVVKKKMATFSNDGYTGDTICSWCKVVIKKGTSIKKISSVKLPTDAYTFSGKVQRPTVIVKDGAGNVLKKNTDYTVKYSGNGKSVGRYTVTTTFKGNYKGKKTVSYTINPKNMGLKSVTRGAKAFTVKWNKQTKEVTGYQIRYSLKKNMSGSKTTTIKNTKTTSCKIKKLKANKKYYVQIRTYKTAGGKTYYSTWSKAKTVTMKK